MYVHAPEFGGTQERVRIEVQMLKYSDGVWAVCWSDVMTQMVVALVPMMHLNGGSSPEAVFSQADKRSLNVRACCNGFG